MSPRRHLVNWWKRRRLARADRRGTLTIFNLHQGGDRFDPLRHDGGTFTATADLMRELGRLKGLYRILPIREALARQRAGHDEALAAVTIDDGDVSLTTHLLPAFATSGVPASVYLSTGMAGAAWGYWNDVVRVLERDPALAHLRARLPADVRRRLRHTRDAAEYAALDAQVMALVPELPPRPPAYLAAADYALLDQPGVEVGLHGHEHQRFAVMPPAWRDACLDRCLELLKGHPRFVPVVALPFGRPQDVDADTLERCRARGLEPLLADGGVNRGVPADGWRRIPVDGRDWQAAAWDEFAACGA